MAEHTLDPPTHRRTLIFLAKAGITAVAIWWIAQFVDLDRTLSLLKTVQPVPLIAALLVLMVQAAAGALRWREIVVLQGGRLGLVRSMNLFFLGTFFNQTLSSTIGGDAVRVWRLRATGMTRPGRRRRRPGTAGRVPDAGNSGGRGPAPGPWPGGICAGAAGGWVRADRSSAGPGHAGRN